MEKLTTSLLSRACRVFLSHSYPGGLDTIPAKRRTYNDLPDDQPVANFLPPAACASGVCQEMRNQTGKVCGYDLRLGSSEFPHLKLRVQSVSHNGQPLLVFMVDTHDAFSRESRIPPADHPDAARWLQLQNANRVLKEKIEAAFEENGLTTMNSLLRGQLQG